MNQSHELPLKGLRVLDVATLFAGPMIATLMGDFGADVIKIEHPRGDSVRTIGWKREDESLWWTFLGRNKRCVTLDLHTPDGQQLLREVAGTADVLVENFRPGVMESWGLGPDDLAVINPRLVIVRTTGFGQTGPYAQRVGFGTLAEAMSGYCHMNGYPDGPPTLPPFALADGIAALFGVSATMFAIYERDISANGEGQVIDLSLYEPLFWLLGPQTTVYDQLGIVQTRTGNRAPFTSPRNMYQSSDGKWLALSASSQSIAQRVMILCGRRDLTEQPWFADHTGRLDHEDELDAAIADWIGQRPWRDVIEAFNAAEAAIAPVYSIEDILEDAHVRARMTIATCDHPTLGPIKMQGVVPMLSRTPGAIRTLGRPLGADNEDVLCNELGYDRSDLARWRSAGVIA